MIKKVAPKKSTKPALTKINKGARRTPEHLAVMEAFGQALRKERLSAGLTLEKLAEKSDMTLRYVQDVQAGRKLPSLMTVIKLCIALKITPDVFLTPAMRTYKKSVKENG